MGKMLFRGFWLQYLEWPLEKEMPPAILAVWYPVLVVHRQTAHTHSKSTSRSHSVVRHKCFRVVSDGCAERRWRRVLNRPQSLLCVSRCGNSALRILVRLWDCNNETSLNGGVAHPSGTSLRLAAPQSAISTSEPSVLFVCLSTTSCLPCPQGGRGFPMER